MSKTSLLFMQKVLKILLCFLFALLLLYSQPSLADSKIKTCGSSIPQVAKDGRRNIKAGVRGTVYSNASGKGSQLLPPIGQEQEYREYDLDTANTRLEDRGKYRIVALTYTKKGKTIYDPLYLTLDHYETFCEMR